MRFSTFPLELFALVVASVALVASGAMLFAQETTGGLQGTVKDASGAVVIGAHVEVTATNLVGTKSLNTDSAATIVSRTCHPATYTMAVTAKGFKSVKREGLVLEVGHLPTVDIILRSRQRLRGRRGQRRRSIDRLTTETTQTNITQDVVQDVPHGRSFQSVIQFAPSARNEPLEGSTATNGTGGNAPGSTTNGGAFGYSVGGASDAENSYLVEGQQTANLIGGYSHTNVPFDFIQEVQIKSSGVEAEHGGALGGVVNVIMKKGRTTITVRCSCNSKTTPWTDRRMRTRDTIRINLSAPGDPRTGGTVRSTAAILIRPQNYQPVRANTAIFPWLHFRRSDLEGQDFRLCRHLTPSGMTRNELQLNMPVSQLLALAFFPSAANQQTYYTTARVDAAVSQKVRLFGSWLYQYQRRTA